MQQTNALKPSSCRILLHKLSILHVKNVQFGFQFVDNLLKKSESSLM